MDISEDLRKILTKLVTLDTLESPYNEEEYVEQVDSYLLELEDWQIKYQKEIKLLSDSKVEGKTLASELESERFIIRDLLTKLEISHSSVMTKTKELLGEVGAEIQKVNKSSKVIKKYIDTHPMMGPGLTKKG